MPDFRSDRSESPEGRGLARRAWDAYAKKVNATAAAKKVNAVAVPALEPSIRRYATGVTVDMVGFWMMWHLHGGFEGLVKFGMHPSTVWRKVNRFRTLFGEHPDEYRFPGVTIDATAYWDAARRAAESKTSG